MRFAVRYTNVDVLALVAGGRQWRRLVAPLVFLLALATLCVAVARPHVHTLVASDKATVVLVLDVSGSMESNDVKPSRLAAAQTALHLFLDHVPKKLKVGLVLFAGEAEVATPPTTDHELVRRRSTGPATSRATAAPRSATRSPSRYRSASSRSGSRTRGRARRRARPAASSPSFTVAARQHVGGPRLDPLPLRRPPESRHPPAAPGRGAREAGRDPGLHDRLRHERRRQLPFPGANSQGGGGSSSRRTAALRRAVGPPARPGDAEGNRPDHRRAVLPREDGEVGPGRIHEARHQPRPQAGQRRGDRLVPRRRRIAPRLRRRALDALGTTNSLKCYALQGREVVLRRARGGRAATLLPDASDR